VSQGAILNILDFGAIPDSTQANTTNAASIMVALLKAQPGDTVLVPGGHTFHAIGGIGADSLHDVTVQIDGTLAGVPDFDRWPMDGKGYLHFLNFTRCSKLTLTGNGTIDGQGLPWWNKWVIGSTGGKKRPKLVEIKASTDVLVENLKMMNSPSFHLLLTDVARVEVRFLEIHVDRGEMRRLKKLKRSLRMGMPLGSEVLNDPVLQPEDLNTDGIDPSGRDVWIHDCFINNDDDSIAVKPCRKGSCTTSDCSQNMLIENMILAGFGASIGSVPPDADAPSCVRNITFKNISMPKTGKGIYIKSNPGCGRGNGTASATISDILYEDIRITEPRWWAIWIGPQQQHEPGSDLGDKCALDYPISGECPTQVVQSPPIKPNRAASTDSHAPIPSPRTPPSPPFSLLLSSPLPLPLPLSSSSLSPPPSVRPGLCRFPQYYPPKCDD
jgi:polygalacturonase